MARREACHKDASVVEKGPYWFDADTGQIIAADLTSKDVDDGAQVVPSLEQIAGPVASFIGDGAYDGDDGYREVCQRHPDAAVIVPRRSSAVPSATGETAPT